MTKIIICIGVCILFRLFVVIITLLDCYDMTGRTPEGQTSQQMMTFLDDDAIHIQRRV